MFINFCITFAEYKFIMPLTPLNILVICTSLLAWLVLSIAGISQFKYNRFNKKIYLIVSILLVLWTISFYNTWYQGFYLFGKIALISSLNSWGLTLLTPLLYLFFRFRITNRLPDKRQWMLHLLPSGILASIYIGMSYFSPSSDRSIYTWNEIILNHTTWWALFRIGCFFVMILQLAVYLPGICKTIRLNDKSSSQTRLVKRELMYILCFYFISLLDMLTTSYLFNILYNISIALIGKYILDQTAFYRAVKSKINSFLNSYIYINTVLNTDDLIDLYESSKNIETQGPAETKITENKETHILTPEKEEELNILIKSPEYLHNSRLTLKMLARALGTNATTLSHYFNKQLGLRFAQYIANLRLTEAETLLKDTDLTVTDISEQVGFQNISTFYQVFKNKHTMPPFQWRKTIKE